MKLCIVGAGAIGGMLGARLAAAGETVSFIERDPSAIAAINADGIKLVTAENETIAARNVRATADFREPGPQDVIILAVKAHQIPGIAADLRALFGPQTSVVTVQNGLPWWYFQRLGGEYGGYRVEAVDPTGSIGANIEAERIIGCVVYPAGEVIAPGVIHQVEGNRFVLGELDGSQSARAEQLAQTLTNAGFKSYVIEDIRSELWLKLWGNLSFNPISALTYATLVDICRFPLTRELAAEMMREAQEIAQKLGVTFRHTIEKRIAGAESVGAHKTSMLQDVEAGRALEIDALVGAVVELGRLTKTPTPHIDAVYACTKLLDRTIQAERKPVEVA